MKENNYIIGYGLYVTQTASGHIKELSSAICYKTLCLNI